MLRHLVGAIQRPVLSSGTTETYHKVGKTSFNIVLYRLVGKSETAFKETLNFPLFLEEIHYRFISSCQ